MALEYILPIFLVFLASILYLFTRDTKLTNLKSKCVVITGCDTGFGHQLAINLDKLGLHVFAACLNDEGRQQLQAKCSIRLQTVLMDVTNSQDIQRCLKMVEDFLNTNKNIDLVGIVNNAGIDISGFFDWSPIENIKKVFDVNLWGVLEVTKAFLPLLKKYKGRIVNVGSVLGKFALRGAGAYSASKFAVQCYSDVLRQELRPFGITVHIIDPGFFKTNITDLSKKKPLMKHGWNNLPQEKRDEYGEDFLEKVFETSDHLLKLICQEMTPVIQAMEHAVTSSSPRLRYIVGWDHKLMWRWFAMLPSGMQDMIIDPLIPDIKASKK